MKNEDLLKLQNAFNEIPDSTVMGIKEAKATTKFEKSLKEVCDEIREVISKISNYTEEEKTLLQTILTIQKGSLSEEKREELIESVNSTDSKVKESVERKEMEINKYLSESPEKLPSSLSEEFYPNNLPKYAFATLIELSSDIE